MEVMEGVPEMQPQQAASAANPVAGGGRYDSNPMAGTWQYPWYGSSYRWQSYSYSRPWGTWSGSWGSWHDESNQQGTSEIVSLARVAVQVRGSRQLGGPRAGFRVNIGEVIHQSENRGTQPKQDRAETAWMKQWSMLYRGDG